MNKKFIIEYLAFSKKERTAVLILVMLMIAVFVLPYFLPETHHKMDKELLKAIEIATAENKNIAIKSAASTSESYPGYKKAGGFEKRSDVVFFNFDPNTLSTEGWIKLGVKAGTAATISKYVSKGGKFRKPDDLLKIYSLSPGLANELMPYVRIEGEIEERKVYSKPLSDKLDRPPPVKSLVDINLADSITLVGLNGIGPTLASRILKFRDRLGGFYSTDQLAEVYGLKDSSFQKLLPQVGLTTFPLKKININTADKATLGKHPYIGYKLAAMILHYREEHGNFSSVDDLLKIELVTEAILKKTSPYLVLVGD